MIRIEIEGEKAAIKGLETAKKEFIERIEDDVFVLADDIANKASSRVPVDQGVLYNSIYKEVDGLNAVVGASANYAPFVEFGTGTEAKVPAGLEDYAKKFQGRNFGSFEEFKKNLLDWMRIRGIPEDALWPIMMKILRVGVTARPFLFNSAFEELNILLDKYRKDGIIEGG